MVAATGGQRADIDELLANRAVLLVVGPGGVGKTTLAAALAARAAQDHGRRVLVVTVDPARRLAEALGVEQVPADPVLVPLANTKVKAGAKATVKAKAKAPAAGRLWALMVDMSRSWDELVRRHGPDPAQIEALLANPLYRSLTTRFVQSHDYIALDLMCDLADDDRYDLVVIDTPPSTHAIDILDAPGRMVEFFDSRLLRWLIAPYQTRLARVTAKPFLAVAERLLGQGFLAGIAEFFWLFVQLQPSLVTRAAEVGRRLDDPATGYVLVTTAEPAALEASGLLLDELAARGHAPDVVLHNRALPAVPPGAVAAEVVEGAVHDPELARAMTDLLRHDQTLTALHRRRPSAGAAPLAVRSVDWQPGTVNTVSQLLALLR